MEGMGSVTPLPTSHYPLPHLEGGPKPGVGDQPIERVHHARKTSGANRRHGNRQSVLDRTRCCGSSAPCLRPHKPARWNRPVLGTPKFAPSFRQRQTSDLEQAGEETSYPRSAVMLSSAMSQCEPGNGAVVRGGGGARHGEQVLPPPPVSPPRYPLWPRRRVRFASAQSSRAGEFNVLSRAHADAPASCDYTGAYPIGEGYPNQLCREVFSWFPGIPGMLNVGRG